MTNTTQTTEQMSPEQHAFFALSQGVEAGRIIGAFAKWGVMKARNDKEKLEAVELFLMEIVNLVEERAEQLGILEDVVEVA